VITLAIASILITGVAPSFTASIQNTRMATQINELHTSLSLARSEAIKRNDNVTVCRSSTGISCTGNWQNGWIVFVDNDFDGSVDAGDEILRVHGLISKGSTLVFSQTRVIYAANGVARGGSNGTFTLCDSRGATSAKGLIIGPSGRPRHAMDSDANGILQDGNNLDLVCSS
jgi:type IV fimbrial biogenesis protein FimT